MAPPRSTRSANVTCSPRYSATLDGTSIGLSLIGSKIKAVDLAPADARVRHRLAAHFGDQVEWPPAGRFALRLELAPACDRG